MEKEINFKELACKLDNYCDKQNLCSSCKIKDDCKHFIYNLIDLLSKIEN